MQRAFENLKIKITSAPVLAFSDFEEPFVIDSDVCLIAVEAVLLQKKDDGKLHPVHFADRAVKKAKNNYSSCR